MLRQSRNKKVILGITGSFGSGKSTVAGFFKVLGVRVIDADRIAHSIAGPKTRIHRRIIRCFGKGIMKEDKNIDRHKLAQIVFANRSALKKLNKVMHPEIIRVMKDGIANSRERLVVLDAPLLIEAGLKDTGDKLIVVKINQKQQIERMIKKTSLSKNDILKRIRSQMPLSMKLRGADFIIDNSGTIDQTKKQVEKIYRKVKRGG